MAYRLCAATCGLLAACSFSGPGTSGDLEPAADGGVGDQPDAAEVGGDAAGADCAPLPGGALAWWDGEALGVDVLGQFPMSETFPAENGPEVSPGLVGNAMTLEEDEDIIIDPPPLPASFSIEGWILRQKNDPGDYMTIYGNGLDAGLFLFNHRLAYYDADADPVDVVIGATVIPLDVYTHVAVVSNGSIVTLYVNGAQDGVGNGNGATISLPDPGRIGGLLFDESFGDDGDDFVGQIDELTVYDRLLAVAEISAIVDAGHRGKCKP